MRCDLGFLTITALTWFFDFQEARPRWTGF